MSSQPTAFIITAFLALSACQVASESLMFDANIQNSFCDSYRGSSWALLYGLNKPNGCFDAICYPEDGQRICFYDQSNGDSCNEFTCKDLVEFKR